MQRAVEQRAIEGQGFGCSNRRVSEQGIGGLVIAQNFECSVAASNFQKQANLERRVVESALFVEI